MHPGGDDPADVQCCINHTLGKCKEDSGCKYLHLKVKCRFKQRFGKFVRNGCTFGHTDEAKLRVCRYFQTNTCNRESCRFEHKLLDRGVCWAAYEQHCECIWTTLFQRKNWHTFHGNFLEIRAGAGGPVCFLCTWQPFGPSAGTQDFFFFLLGLVHT